MQESGGFFTGSAEDFEKGDTPMGDIMMNRRYCCIRAIAPTTVSLYRPLALISCLNNSCGIRTNPVWRSRSDSLAICTRVGTVFGTLVEDYLPSLAYSRHTVDQRYDGEKVRKVVSGPLVMIRTTQVSVRDYTTNRISEAHA